MNGFECIPGILFKGCQATVLGYMPRIHQYNLVKVGHDNKDLQNESLAKIMMNRLIPIQGSIKGRFCGWCKISNF